MTDRTCPDCGEPVIRARTEAMNWQLLNPEPDPAGNVHARSQNGAWLARTVTKGTPAVFPEQLMMPHKATCAAPSPEHHCHASGCKTRVQPRLLMCGRHWRMVPPALQDAVWAAYVRGQEIRKDPTLAYLAAARAAIQAVQVAEQHKAQRDQVRAARADLGRRQRGARGRRPGPPVTGYVIPPLPLEPP
jgi:hypothetical protein